MSRHGRIRVLTIQPHPVHGGPIEQHLSFIAHLDPARFELHVVLPPAHPERAAFEAVASSVHDVEGLAMLPRSLSPRRLARASLSVVRQARHIARLARRLDADVVHTLNEICPAGSLGARLARRPAVVHVIGMTIFQPAWTGALMSGIHRLTCDRIVCCQEVIRDAFRSLGVPDDKLTVIYNSVDPAEIAADAEAGPAPRIEPDTLRVGTVFAFSKRKGPLPFTRAAVLVCRELPEARFFLVGSLIREPDQVEQVRRVVAEAGLEGRIVLTGRVESVPAWLRSFDVYCIPSLSEALSVAGLEAMCLGRPLVATAIGGNPVAVEAERTGLLCPADDPRALADAILELLRDPNRRRAFGEAGRRRVEERFTSARSAAALGAVFEAVVARH